MKILNCIGLVLFLSLASYAKEKVNLYLMIGQSNMAGRAKVNAEDADSMKGCLLLNDKGKLEEAKNPLNRYSTIRKGLNMQKLGPSYSFALEMQKSSKNDLVGLVVNAKGGSKIKSWKKGSKFFEDAVKRVKLALADEHYDVVLKGVCWHQGESDHTDKEYVKKLSDFVKNLRAALGDKKLPFVVGQINAKVGGPTEVFNQQLLVIEKKVKGVKVVMSKDLKAYDRWHFDTPSVKELGKRYAVKMQELLK